VIEKVLVRYMIEGEIRGIYYAAEGFSTSGNRLLIGENLYPRW